MRSLMVPLVLLGAVVAGGCGDLVPEGEDAVPRLELVEVDRIGSVDGPDAFSDVAEVAVGGGELYVLERQRSQVVRVDASGDRSGTFGRGGSGPGEFSRPTTLGVTGERIWVADMGARKMEIFSLDGEPVATLRIEIPADPGGAPAVALAYLASGHLIAGPAFTSIGAAVDGTLEHETFYLVDRDGEVLDTLYRRPVPGTDFVQGELGERRMFMGPHPLSERPERAFFPDGSGMVVVERWEASAPDSASYRVKVWNAIGDLEVDRPIPYVPMSAEGWLEREIAEMREGSADAPQDRRAMTERMIDEIRKNSSARQFVPPVTRIVAGGDGTILVRREEAGADSVRWDLLERSGERVGTFSTPTDVAIEAANSDEIWAVVTDELDVPYVVRYRLEERP